MVSEKPLMLLQVKYHVWYIKRLLKDYSGLSKKNGKESEKERLFWRPYLWLGYKKL